MEDGTVASVSVSALAILFASEAGERHRRAEFAESVNLRQGSTESFAEQRASNYSFARIRFAWLRFARGLRESEYAGA